MKVHYILMSAAALITCVVCDVNAAPSTLVGVKLKGSEPVVHTTKELSSAPANPSVLLDRRERRSKGRKEAMNKWLSSPAAKKKIQTVKSAKVSENALSQGHAQYEPKIGLNFTATTNVTQNNPRATSFIDCMGAPGPEQYIVFTNNALITLDKETGKRDGVLDVTLSSFIGEIFPIPFAVMTDPEIRFDTFSKRWFLTFFTEEQGPGFSNHLIIAMSDGPVIERESRWTFFTLQINQVNPAVDFDEFFDFEGLGIDKHALYLGYLSEGNTTGSYDTAALIIQKKSLLDGGPVVATDFRGLLTSNGTDFPRGVDNFDECAEHGFFSATFVESFEICDIAIYRVNNPGSTHPTLSGPEIVPGTTFFNPAEDGVTQSGLNVPLVPHKGNILGDDQLLDLEAGVIFNPHIRDNHLFGAVGTMVNAAGVGDPDTADRGACIFFEIDVQPETPTLIQRGQLFDPTTDHSPIWYFMPVCMTNKRQDLVMGFTIAGENEYVNVGAVGRFKSDPLGALSDVVRLTHNKQPFNAGIRWGDYSNASQDPDGKRIWTSLEFVSDQDVYAQRITEFLPPKK